MTEAGVTDYGGKPMSVIKVSYEGRGQKRKRDDSNTQQRGGRGGRGGGRGDKNNGYKGGRGGDGAGKWGQEWPGGAQKYCKFALGKSNMDTQVHVRLADATSHTQIENIRLCAVALTFMGKACLCA